MYSCTHVCPKKIPASMYPCIYHLYMFTLRAVVKRGADARQSEEAEKARRVREAQKELDLRRVPDTHTQSCAHVTLAAPQATIEDDDDESEDSQADFVLENMPLLDTDAHIHSLQHAAIHCNTLQHSATPTMTEMSRFSAKAAHVVFPPSMPLKFEQAGYCRGKVASAGAGRGDGGVQQGVKQGVTGMQHGMCQGGAGVQQGVQQGVAGVQQGLQQRSVEAQQVTSTDRFGICLSAMCLYVCMYVGM